jgi:hypothetical protein
MTVLVTVEIPDWLFEHLGRPDPAVLARRVLEALAADCLRTGLVTTAKARDWLDLHEPGAMDAFLKAYGITPDGTETIRGA